MYKRKIVICVLLIFSLMINHNVLSSENIGNIDIDYINAYLSSEIKDKNIAGMQVNIVKQKELLYSNSFGYSNINEKKVIDDESYFELASNSKSITGLGILKLSEDGLISLEDSVYKYIPDLALIYKKNKSDVTIEQLLHHTSGIPFKSIEKIPVIDGNFDKSLKETVKKLNNYKLATKPGDKYSYATINYDILGLVIENITGSYESYIYDNILKPLGLNNTYLGRKSGLTTGYKLDFLQQVEYDAPYYEGNLPAAYITMNSTDAERWLKIQLGSIDDLSDEYKNLICKSHLINPTNSSSYSGTSYAIGWFVNNNDKTIFHGGNNPNYSSYFLINQETKMGISILCNSNNDYLYKIAQNIERITNNQTPLEIKYDKYTISGIVSSVIIVGTIIALLVFLYLLISKRKCEKILKARKILVLNALACLSILIYLLPIIVYGGITWNYVYVWLPKSVNYAVVLIYLLLALAAVYTLKKDEEK